VEREDRMPRLAGLLRIWGKPGLAQFFTSTPAAIQLNHHQGPPGAAQTCQPSQAQRRTWQDARCPASRICTTSTQLHPGPPVAMLQLLKLNGLTEARRLLGVFHLLLPQVPSRLLLRGAG
jgi:hypothetical protein